MSLLSKRPRVDHAKTAARLRAHPHMWIVVGEYRSTVSADGIARDIRSAFQRHIGRAPSPYRPAGSFESRMELTEDGVQVIARYVGEGGDGRA